MALIGNIYGRKINKCTHGGQLLHLVLQKNNDSSTVEDENYDYDDGSTLVLCNRRYVDPINTRI